jgi:hypothetical protein
MALDDKEIEAIIQKVAPQLQAIKGPKRIADIIRIVVATNEATGKPAT